MLKEDEVDSPARAKDSQSTFEEHLAIETVNYYSRLALDGLCQQVVASGSGSSNTRMEVIVLEDTPATSEMSVEDEETHMINNVRNINCENLKAHGFVPGITMCELCGFKPKTKNKYREKQDHLYMKHFKEEFDRMLPNGTPWNCPAYKCTFFGKDKQALLRHFMGKHGILEKYLSNALAKLAQPPHETSLSEEPPIVLLEDTVSSPIEKMHTATEECADPVKPCVLCGFKPTAKKERRAMYDHLYMKHFKEEFDRMLPTGSPWNCPADMCPYFGTNKQALLRHFMSQHGILEKWLSKALAKLTQPSQETALATEPPVVLLNEDTT